jgi:hypothetical protein
VPTIVPDYFIIDRGVKFIIDSNVNLDEGVKIRRVKKEGRAVSYRFEAGRIYRMPTHFGPAFGPRQLSDDVVVDPKRSRRTLSVTASFLTDPVLLERHLPEGFTLAGEPVVTVEFHHMTDIDWLAGRGYTMIWVSWPATFTGSRDHATGKFLAVVWENLADPIITGRDEIGHPKLYADIEEPRRWNGVQICTAGWMAFAFLSFKSRSCMRRSETSKAPLRTEP